jgi:heme-degrading monooxygenase HmoA
MIVRLTYLNFLPQRAEEAKKIYNEEVVPVVRKQKGSIDCKLMEPADKADDYISMTTWETKADADAYHSSGVYKELVNKVRSDFSKEPVLKIYSAEGQLQPA